MPVDEASDFSLANLPYGVFTRRGQPPCPRPCTAIGDFVVDLAALAQAGCFSGPVLSRSDCFQQVCQRGFVLCSRGSLVGADLI